MAKANKKDYQANPHDPIKIIVKNSPKYGMEENASEIAEQEHKEFIRMVLDDEPVKSKGITRGFARSRKEDEMAERIAHAQRIETTEQQGLSTAQVDGRKEEGLVNVATTTNKKTYAAIFVQNICTFFNLICILIAVALICVNRWSDLTFMVIMTLNTVIGLVQECRSKRTIDKLSIVSAPVALVRRDGVKVTIPVADVVLDDILYLENGKQICADSIIVEGKIQVNEAMLTGESALVSKAPGDQLYAGSFVVSGSCSARVDKVGNANYIESLTAFAKRYKKAGSQLLISIQKLIGVIGILIIPIAVLMFLNNLAVYAGQADQMPLTIATTAGAIIGMIPAGMFLLTSVALAVGVIKLANNHVLVQDLYCIEMLARADVLCLDKTGTITDGTMNVAEVIKLRDMPGNLKVEDVVGSFLTATKDNNQTAIAVGKYFGYNAKMQPSAVIPFSSQRKLSAVTFDGAGTFFLGAPEFVLPNMDIKLKELVNSKAKEGMRVLAWAHSISAIKGEHIPSMVKCLSLICIEDHIRDDAYETIAWFKNNDVSVKVISGDNPITVAEVARRAGIENAEKFISLEGMSDQDVIEAANQYTVFGRVTPEQKRLLVRSIKLKGHTVAMTGDGVNDILALKEADCSVAMATGSEAARNVSHMVLMDSNFGNMPTVVLEGRRVINNIQKSASLYTMKTMFSFLLSILVIVIGTTMPIAYPVTPKNMLLLEMFIIGIPSFFLAFQSNKERIRGRFMNNLLRETLPGGIAMVAGYIALYAYTQTVPGGVDPATVKSMTVLILTFTGLTMLVRLCQPLNLYRGLLCVGSGLLVSLVISLSIVSNKSGFFYGMFEVCELDLTNTLFVIAVVLLSYVLAATVAMLIRAIHKPNKNNLQEKL